MSRNDNPDAVGVSLLRGGPANLANHRRFADVADIQDDNAHIAVRQIRPVLISCNVVQVNPDLRQYLVFLDPIFSRLFSSGRPGAGIPPARYLFGVGRIGNVGDDQNVAKVALFGRGNKRKFSLLRIFVQPETVDAAARYVVGLEKPDLARARRIADIIEPDAWFALVRQGVAQPLLIDYKNVSQDVDVLALNTRLIRNPRHHARLLCIADVNDAGALIISRVRKLAVLAYAKLCGSIPAIEIAVG